MYHINPETGRTNICRAKTKCRYKNTIHATTKEETKQLYEQSMKNQTFKKTTKKSLLNNIKITNNDNVLKRIEKINSLEYCENFSKESINFLETVYNGEIPENFPQQLTNISQGIQAHTIFQEMGYYAKITKNFAKELKSNIKPNSTIIDPMAGKGYLVKALREQGIKTIGSDDYSWSGTGHFDKDHVNNSFENIDAVESIEKNKDVITHVVVSWAPYDDNIDYKIFQKIKEINNERQDDNQINIIYIGESYGGCTGSDVFHENVLEAYDNEFLNSYETCGGLHDYATIIKLGWVIIVFF